MFLFVKLKGYQQNYHDPIISISPCRKMQVFCQLCHFFALWRKWNLKSCIDYIEHDACHSDLSSVKNSIAALIPRVYKEVLWTPGCHEHRLSWAQKKALWSKKARDFCQHESLQPKKKKKTVRQVGFFFPPLLFSFPSLKSSLIAHIFLLPFIP